MNDLQVVNDRLNALIGNLSAPVRKEMARNIAKKLRSSQQKNIKSQQAPDGTPFKPRKAQPIRCKKGRVKREMFVKLRTAKYLKAQATPDQAMIQFVGNANRIAKIHHYGLRDRISLKGKYITYDERPLLGIGAEDYKMIEEELMKFLLG